MFEAGIEEINADSVNGPIRFKQPYEQFRPSASDVDHGPTRSLREEGNKLMRSFV